MKCADCQDVLADYALDSLGPLEAEQVAAHLADGCMECQQQLEDVRASWAAMAGTLQPINPPSHVRADLLARLRSESTPTSGRFERVFTPEPEPVTLARHDRNKPRRWRGYSMLAYAAATLCGIAFGFWFASTTTSDAELADRYHAQLQKAERTFGVPPMRFAALHVSENRPEIRGHLIWDSMAEELHVYAFDLGAPGEGSLYRLSFVQDDGTWVAVGDLNVGPDGVCSAVLELPRLTGAVARVVVTTEPLDATIAVGQSHGPIGLTGKFLKQQPSQQGF